MPIPDPHHAPVAAGALALPSARFDRAQITDWTSALTEAAAAIAGDTGEA